jgi:hypothetical protein
MISPSDWKSLLDICNKFINSGEDITLAHLLDSLNSISLDHTSDSEEYKDWSNYMEKLNEAVETVSIQAKRKAW